MSKLCMCHPAVSSLCLAIWVVNTTTTGIFCSPSHCCRTHFGAFALCVAWQQCEVNRMNKTYLKKNPLPGEMSSCQYSLMGKHRASPKGRTVYLTAPICIQIYSFFAFHKHKLELLQHLICAIYFKRVRGFFIYFCLFEGPICFSLLTRLPLSPKNVVKIRPCIFQ